jgi:4-diphosphocytidyl-2-C-methyl-D-erythritol kinase
LPKDSLNLAFRSAKLLQDSLKLNKGVNIKIVKRIPMGSGLGGGSSNAASVLMGLNKIWKLKLSQKKLSYLGAKVGSDVPFFIYDCPFALGKGRGDKIRPLKGLNKVRLWHILIVPKICVSTPLIYKNWDELKSRRSPPSLKTGNRNKNSWPIGLTRPKYSANIIISALRKNDFLLLKGAIFNSLESVATALYPEVLRIKEKLLQFGLQSILMSGSGPAVFGVVSSRKEAVGLCRQLKKRSRFWQVFLTRTV